MPRADWYERLDVLVGQEVVLDTKSSYIYIGKLTELDDHFLVLTDADVHDGRESHTTKELYIMDAKKYGIKKNRTQVMVRADEIVSISALAAVIEY